MALKGVGSAVRTQKSFLSTDLDPNPGSGPGRKIQSISGQGMLMIVCWSLQLRLMLYRTTFCSASELGSNVLQNRHPLIESKKDYKSTTMT